jgi:hypothetical protein
MNEIRKRDRKSLENILRQTPPNAEEAWLALEALLRP